MHELTCRLVEESDAGVQVYDEGGPGSATSSQNVLCERGVKYGVQRARGKNARHCSSGSSVTTNAHMDIDDRRIMPDVASPCNFFFATHFPHVRPKSAQSR